MFQIARKQHDLKKKLKVVFAGEPGLDMGGLTKEWFLLLIRKIFHQDYGKHSAETCDRLLCCFSLCHAHFGLRTCDTSQ